ncbi:hypothetical protein DPMN_105781 [Dreissena polymorpha]|uniref:Uncharacterized protein n=1 Tax=Dreissena polymorpha TaxID=45954 RepID=A0A9D4K3T3_DREPO|nr:hypothetical protein DPMN_105781 [Dreissena polymorpha]
MKKHDYTDHLRKDCGSMARWIRKILFTDKVRQILQNSLFSRSPLPEAFPDYQIYEVILVACQSQAAYQRS